MVSIKFKNARQVKADFSRFSRTFNRDVIKIIRNDLIPDFEQTENILFRKEGSSGAHGKWPKLTDAYAKRKRNNPKSATKGIMRLSEKLRLSLTDSRSSYAIRSIVKAGDKLHIKLGTSATSKGGFDYPEFHQTNGLKARRTIDPSKADLVEWMKSIHYGLFEKVRKEKRLFDPKRMKIAQGKWDKITFR